MSAAKMVADSTQSELADTLDGKKKKKKIKKASKKVLLPEDEDSDLDLKKDLKPIVTFVKDRPAMIREMFRAVRGASLQRALPDLLKSIPLDELEQLCLEQLEVMSKKRIRRILAGEESCNISSSGTEDETSDEESPDQPSEQTNELLTDLENHQADSTSVRQELTRSQMEGTGEDQPSLCVVKQEPPDSGDDEVEPEEEEVPETYTSGSEDGELVRKEDQLDDSTEVKVKEEPQSGSEEEGEEDMEEDDLVASMPLGSDGVLPSIMMDQMELLELEMRARAIKAMLSSHDEGD